jgi:23S rRNA (pseudouridine1915-N3)-methyltransferase
MKISILSIGKWKNSPEEKIFLEYKKRLPWKLELIEIDEKRVKTLPEKIPPKSYKIALDENGKQFTSREFANLIGKLQVDGTSEITFLIGAADGHDKQTLDNADLRLSFGKMTMPHMLVRPVLAEQLYRAHSILQGHPYHRD